MAEQTEGAVVERGTKRGRGKGGKSTPFVPAFPARLCSDLAASPLPHVPPHPHPIQSSHRGNPLFSQPISRAVGGNALLLRDLEDPKQGLVDLAGFLLGPLDRPAV